MGRIHPEAVSTLSLVACKHSRGLLRVQLTKQWGFLKEEKLCWRISSNLPTLMPLVDQQREHFRSVRPGSDLEIGHGLPQESRYLSWRN